MLTTACVGIADCSPEDRQPSSEGGRSARLRVPASATLTLVGLKPSHTVIDRPGPECPASVSAPSLDRLVKDARATEKRIADLEQTRKRTATALLLENLDQAQQIETAVERGQSVAAFARQAGIRRAPGAATIQAGSTSVTNEAESDEADPGVGDDFVSVLEAVSASRKSTEPEDNGTELAKKLSAELARAQSKIAELEAHRLGNSGYGMFGRGNPIGKPLNGSLITMTANSTLVWMSAPPQRTKSASCFHKAENGLRRKWLRNIWLRTHHTAKSNRGAKRLGSTLQTGKEVVVALLPLWPTAPWFKKYVIHGHIRLLTTHVQVRRRKG